MSRKRLNKTKYEIVKTWLSSFVVTVVAVITVVVFVPKSPEATFIKVMALEDVITYQVKVTDEDQALDLDSLKVVLENQMDYFEVDIDLGETSGYFEGLSQDTEYRLSIYGSKGYGQERLDTRVVRTKSRTGGFILGYEQVGDSEEPSYEVEVYLNDPDMIYSEVKLYYGYGYEDQFFYESVPITLSREKIVLDYLFSTTHVYLEAVTDEGTIVLDEMWITPKYVLMSSFQLEYIDRYEAGITLFNSSGQSVEVSYQVDVYEGETKRKSIIIKSSDFESYSKTVNIDDLKELTDYRIVVQATYINPDTAREEIIVLGEQDIKTLGEYSVEYEIIDHQTYLEVNITVIDPSHYFQVPYFEVYDLQGEYPMWIAGESFDFTPDINSKSVSFTIDLPGINHYQIEIGIRNENNYMIRHIIYDDIIHKG